MAFFSWLNERLDLVRAKHELLDREVPDRLTWWHTLGSATLTVFLVQIITGTVLATYYSASPDHALLRGDSATRRVARARSWRGCPQAGAGAMVVRAGAH